MDSLIKKYASGTPKPFAVSVTKRVASEDEAATFVTSCGDKKAIADKVEGGFIVHYRRWFDELSQAQAFVAAMKEKQEMKNNIAAVKADLKKIVEIVGPRNKDLATKTQAVLDKI